MKFTWNVIVVMLLFCFSACSKSEGADKPAPEYKLSTPENNAVDVRLSTVVEVGLMR